MLLVMNAHSGVVDFTLPGRTDGGSFAIGDQLRGDRVILSCCLNCEWIAPDKAVRLAPKSVSPHIVLMGSEGLR
jgi:hypothetical protein